MAKFVEAPSRSPTKSYYINLDSVACIEQSSQTPDRCSVYFNENAFVEVAISADEFVRRAQAPKRMAKRAETTTERAPPRSAQAPALVPAPDDTITAARARSFKQG